MNERPLISVLTAAYNGAAFLPALIESVLCQEYDRFEHLILDDGSTDDGATASVLARYPNLRTWRQENAGQYAAQNTLLDAAKGDIVVIINQDDLFASPTVFGMVVEAWRSHPVADAVYGNIRYIDADGAHLPYRYAFEGRRRRWLLRRVSCTPHIALFVRREAVEREKIRFDPGLQMAGDWDWFLHFVRYAGEMVHVREIFSLFRLHGEQKTTSRGERGFAPEVRAICRRHGVNPWINSLLRKYVNLRVRMATFGAMMRELGPLAVMRRAGVSLARRLRLKGGNRSS